MWGGSFLRFGLGRAIAGRFRPYRRKDNCGPRCDPVTKDRALPPGRSKAMRVFKTLFAGSAKEHEIGSLFCAACYPHAEKHTGCGVTHNERVPHKTGYAEDCDIVSVCDGCGAPQ